MIPKILTFFFLAAVIILAVIYLSGVHFSRTRPGAGIANTEQELKSFTVELESYRLLAGVYPSNEQGLEALWERPVTNPLPKEWLQLRREVPRDLWGSAYRYAFPGRLDPDRPEIISAGPDQIFDTEDDLSNQD